MTNGEKRLEKLKRRLEDINQAREKDLTWGEVKAVLVYRNGQLVETRISQEEIDKDTASK